MLERSRAPKLAQPRGGADPAHETAGRVTVNERTPRHHIVDVAVAVDVANRRLDARLMNSGVESTAWNARTGLSTPPGGWCRRARRVSAT